MREMDRKNKICQRKLLNSSNGNALTVKQKCPLSKDTTAFILNGTTRLIFARNANAIQPNIIRIAHILGTLKGVKILRRGEK